MNCPNCNSVLNITDREGVEIDYCPQCRGVWLDKGELDKLIERSSRYYEEERAMDQRNMDQRNTGMYDRHEYDDDDYHKGKYGHHGYRKKKSFFERFFDFD